MTDNEIIKKIIQGECWLSLRAIPEGEGCDHGLRRHWRLEQMVPDYIPEEAQTLLRLEPKDAARIFRRLAEILEA